jgi:citrate lyase subunit beta / citryl-CoA lyase
MKMRSWLFAPGDSERKMAKALEGPADIVLLDLEDAVATENKPLARKLVHDFLAANAESRRRIWVRVNPLDGPHTLDDLVAIMPAQPGGIMLPKVYGRQDVELLDHYLTAFEAAHGLERGATPVIVLATETAEAMFHTGDYKGAPRLAALTWGAEDLADSVGANSNRNADGSYSFTYEMARSLTLLGAATAGVPAIETICADFKDLDALRLRAEKVRRDGYRGMLAIHPAQVDVINAPLPRVPRKLPKHAKLLRCSPPIQVSVPSAGRVACSIGPSCRARSNCWRRLMNRRARFLALA